MGEEGRGQEGGGEMRRAGPSPSAEGDVFRNGQGPKRGFNWRTIYKPFRCCYKVVGKM